MNDRLLYIDAVGSTSRVALTDGGEMVELMFDAPQENSQVGNIYRGRVESVLQGMQAAFVDIGRARNAFLYVSDMPVDRRDFDSALPVAEQLSVRVGQEIMVQVVKDEVGTKGARVSTNLSFVGRYVVGMPTLLFYGISRKITDADQRAAMSKLLPSVLPEGWGGIARTVAPTAGKREIKHEADALKYIYDEVKKAYETASVGDVLYRDGDLVYRVGRDVVDGGVSAITINNDRLADRFEKYLGLVGLNKIKVLRYPAEADLFGDFGLSRAIDGLLSGRVALKHGGTLVIGKTEALTAIDVNSGKYVGSTDLEDTVFHVNLEAAREIARQIRLRNSGGIIVVDFIDMDVESHKKEVLRTLEEALKADRVKTRVVDMTPLGLVEITRKKIRHDVAHYLQEPCPYCGGTGLVVAASAVIPEVTKSLNKTFSDPKVSGAAVTVHTAVADALFRGALTTETETVWKEKRVYIIPDDGVPRAEVRVRPLIGSVYDLPDESKLLY